MNMIRRDRGFTLIELIVSLTILSLVTVLIGSGFKLAVNSWSKGENETEWTQKLRVLSGMFSQQLKSAYPYNTEIDDEKVVLFKGNADSITFVTALADRPFGGFKWVRYSYKNDALVYKEGLLPDKEFERKLEGDEEIVDTDIDGIRFEYFSDKEDSWQDTWEPGENIPAAVRVSISYFQPFFVTIPLGKIYEDEYEAESL